jgi:hypothetical protein
MEALLTSSGGFCQGQSTLQASIVMSRQAMTRTQGIMGKKPSKSWGPEGQYMQAKLKGVPLPSDYNTDTPWDEMYFMGDEMRPIRGPSLGASDEASSTPSSPSQGTPPPAVMIMRTSSTEEHIRKLKTKRDSAVEVPQDPKGKRKAPTSSPSSKSSNAPGPSKYSLRPCPKQK